MAVDALQIRMPVWTAMSELFLDTELSHDDHIRIAKVLAASAYSLAKLDEIFRFEVTPVLKSNLMSIAGEWAGFNEDWLKERLAERFDKRPWLKFGVLVSVRKPWQEIIKHVSSFRAEPTRA